MPVAQRAIALAAMLACAGCMRLPTRAPDAAPPPSTATAPATASAATVANADAAQPAEAKPAPAVPSGPTPPPRSAHKPVPAKAAPVPAHKAPEALAAARPAVPSAKAPPAAPQPATPSLDLKGLEQRLKETPAIGVMTKISLKNQVDDLLDKFRDYYAGRSHVSLAELRRPFDMLLMKVLALLQDGDPTLARTIHDSREALWSLLADREKFTKLT